MFFALMLMNMLTFLIVAITYWRVRRVEDNQHIIHAKINGILDLIASIRDAFMRHFMKVRSLRANEYGMYVE
tara:strand:+ start:5399 stop:5614 length:216 start_codon:yes stop_codon:yes gene_type:complete